VLHFSATQLLGIPSQTWNRGLLELNEIGSDAMFTKKIMTMFVGMNIFEDQWGAHWCRLTHDCSKVVGTVLT